MKDMMYIYADITKKDSEKITKGGRGGVDMASLT